MTRRTHSVGLALAAALGVALVAGGASASERRFTYTYESNVLNPGSLEIEPWTTFRGGRDRFYSRFDQRLEFEMGVVPDLQTALYWNMTAVAADVDDGAGGVVRQQDLEFKGISNEWKYKLSDSLADAVGSALYFEWTLAPVEAELEAKLILDKRFGSVLLAYNLVGEHEWEFEEKGETEREIIIENNLGLGYLLTSSFSVGLEARTNTIIEHGEMESTTFFAGPTLAYSQKRWWSALTFQPQIAALKEDEEGADTGSSRLDLAHHERVEVRLLLGFEL